MGKNLRKKRNWQKCWTKLKRHQTDQAEDLGPDLDPDLLEGIGRGKEKDRDHENEEMIQEIIEIQKEDIAQDREIEEIAIARKIITERTDIMIETEIVIGTITEKKKVEEVKIPCQLKKLIKCEPL